MRCQSLAGAFTLAGLLLPVFPLFAAEYQAFTESVVVFNTICAKCHEAECSGRLSFDEAVETSASHILRHYGQASGKKWLQKELFDILNYMKGKCAYFPMQVTVPSTREWSGGTLERFATLPERNYFIPAGYLAAGHYRVELELDRDEKVTVQLISEEFEMVVEDAYPSSDLRIGFPFRIDEPGNYYFRMYPREPVSITRLAIIPPEHKSR
ncbi:MAG: hypothetical protein PVH54_10595 [Gammaproteobacteria bacterium]|jgi:hypothetical protein